MGATTSWGQSAQKRGGGDPNQLMLKGQNKVRLVSPEKAEWAQHVIEDPKDSDQVKFVMCPDFGVRGKSTCPLCRKPAGPDPENPGKSIRYWPKSFRFATNVWDYESNSVKLLIGGKQIFKPFDDAAEVGLDPRAADWVITKQGTRKNTEYTVTRMDASAFQQQVGPDDLHSTDKYTKIPSVDQIFKVLEELGIDYDTLPMIQMNLEQASNFVMPFGKHKGLTVEQAAAVDVDWLTWLHGTRIDDGQIGDEVFVAIHAVLEDMGMVQPLDESEPAAPAPQPQQQAPAPTPAPGDVMEAQAEATSPPEPTMVSLIDMHGTAADYPVGAVDALLEAGFKRADETPEPEPEPEIPTEPESGEIVTVLINGNPNPLAYVDGKRLVQMPGVDARFQDERIQAAYEHATGQSAQRDEDKATRDAVRTQADTEQESPSAVPEGDPEKPFECEECGKGYKTKGGLTQHLKREHPGTIPPEQQNGAAASNGGGADQTLMEEVRTLFAKVPGVQQDYREVLKLLGPFGVNNVADLNDAQLGQLRDTLKERVDA